jgi:predicted esterase
MNRYLVLVTGTKDSIGMHFMQNIVEMANKGATLIEDKVPHMRFPFQAWMSLTTKELMKDSPGFQFQRIEEQFTREQLDAMDWETLKKTIKKNAGITGRDRDLLVNKYLKATGQEK